MKARLTALRQKLADDAVIQKLLSGGIWSLVIKVGSAGLTYLMFVLLARAMTIEDYGRYSFGFNLATFLSVVAGFGLHIAIMRWWPEFIAKGEPQTSVAAYRWSNAMTLGGTVLVSLAMIAAALTFGWIEGEDLTYLVVAALLIGPLCYSEYLGSLLRALGSVGWALVPRDILWRAIVCIITGLALWQGRLLTAFEGMLLTAVVLGVLVIAQMVYLKRHSPEIREFPKAAAPDLHAPWRSTAVALWAATLLYALIQYVDVVLVGLVISPEAAGPYFAVTKTASLVSLLLIASNMICAPLISKYWYQGELAELQRILRLVALGVGVPTLMAFAFIVVFGKWLLGLFGSGFDIAYPALVVLTFGYTVNSLAGPLSYLVQFAGHERAYLRIMATSYILVIASHLILIPTLGILGAAIGSAAGLVLVNIRSVIFARREVGLDPSMLAVFKRPTMSSS